MVNKLATAPRPLAQTEAEALPTLDSYTPSSRKTQGQDSASFAAPEAELQDGSQSQPQTAEELEEDAHTQGAFNEETGEINWDCPCLGGMAHGPCGPQFREAFSCFVFSKEEPKGMDCIDKFKGMQDCFRQHPEIYQAELEDDEREEEEAATAALARDDGATVSAAQLDEAPGVASVVRDVVKDESEAAPTEDAGVSQAVQPQVSSILTTSTESGEPDRQGLRSEHKHLENSETNAAKSTGNAPSMAEAERDLIPQQAHDARDASTKSG